MKMMQGAFFLPCSNMSRTRDAPTPTNISTKSEPEMVKNGTLASPAMARGEQGLARTRRPHQQDALGNLAAQALEFLRVLQVLDDFLKLLLCLIDAGDVLEGDAARLLGQKPGPRFAETHGLAAPRLHLTHEENPHADQEQHGEPGNQDAQQARRVVVRRNRLDAHAPFAELGNQGRVIGRVCGEVAAIPEVAADVVSLDGDFADLAALDRGQEIGKGQARLGRPGRGTLKQIEQRKHQQRDDHPQRQIPAEIQSFVLPRSRMAQGRATPPPFDGLSHDEGVGEDAHGLASYS